MTAARRTVIECTRYCGRLLVDPLPPLLLPPLLLPPLVPEEPPLGARPVWPEPLVDEPAPVLPWPVEPWPDAPWPPRAPPPTLSRVVLEPRTVVDVPLRTVVRVEVPPPTATPPARRLWTTTELEGSR
jgi:type VI secretion system secreted protein VgrG